MKFSNDNLLNEQPKALSKRKDKKSITIKWNSKLFFQIGLIVSLTTVYLIMQTKFEIPKQQLIASDTNYINEIPFYLYTIDEPVITPKKKTFIKSSPPKIINQVIEVVPDNTLEKELAKTVVPTETKTIVVPVKKEKALKPRSVMGVEFVPIFPGCESEATNEEKRNCLSNKIRKFIVKKFNTSKLDDSKSIKSQRITVQFTIDTFGNVTNVFARAPNKLLEKEAVRMVSKLPKMQPGRQGVKNVPVQYTIPITFKIDY